MPKKKETETYYYASYINLNSSLLRGDLFGNVIMKQSKDGHPIDWVLSEGQGILLISWQEITEEHYEKIIGVKNKASGFPAVEQSSLSVDELQKPE